MFGYSVFYIFRMPNISQLIKHSFSYIFKWLGGGIGIYLGGPSGGVLGFVVGTVIDSLFLKREEKRMTGAVSISLLVLLASILKVKSNVNDTKMKFVKQFLRIHYGKNNANMAFIQLTEMMNQNITMNDACEKLRNSLDYPSRLQLVQFFYKLAKIDGEPIKAEQFILNIITEGLDVIQSVKPIILQNETILAAYEILGVNHNTTVIDIKKAYRKLAFAYHPDKVMNLDEDQKNIANEKFTVLTKAYNVIKKERNIT